MQNISILGGIGRRVGTALAIALGMANAPGAPVINFNPGSNSKGGKKYPFSSTRQHRRNARKVYSRKMANGHVVMQTLPTWARRNDVEVDALLDGRLKLQTVDA